jgi:hypothetical protein
MKMKRLLLFSLKFTLLYPSSVFAIDTPVTRVNPRESQEKFESIGYHFEAETSLHIANGILNVENGGMGTNRGGLAPEDSEEVENTDAGEEFSGSDAREYYDEACNHIENKLDDIVSEFSEAARSNQSSRGSSLNERVYDLFNQSNNGFVEILQNGSLNEEFVTHEDTASRIEQAMVSNLGKAIGNACIQNFTSSPSGFCSDRNPGDIKKLCLDYYEKMYDDEALEEDYNKDGPEGIAARAAMQVRSDIYSIQIEDSRRRNEGGDEDANTDLVEIDENGNQRTCLKNDASCYFTKERSGSVLRTGSQCNEFDCTVLGSNPSDIAGEENIGLFNVMSLLSSPENSLNHVGDSSYCDGCLGQKFQQLNSGKSFVEERADARDKLEAKLKEKATKRALFDLSNHMETVQDLIGLSKFLNGSGSKLPKDVYCEDVFDRVLDPSFSVSNCLTSVSEREEILRGALKAMDYNISGNLTGDNIVGALLEKTQEVTGGKCSSSDSLNGREKFALHRLQNWHNNVRFQDDKESLNKLMDSMLSTNKNSTFSYALDQACSGNTGGLEGRGPVEFISDYVADAIHYYTKNNFECDPSNTTQIDNNRLHGFVEGSIFQNAICKKSYFLGKAIRETENMEGGFKKFLRSYPRSVRENLDTHLDDLKKEYLKRKTKKLLELGMDMDPRNALQIGSWQGVCDSYKKANPAGVGGIPQSYSDQIAGIQKDDLKDIKTELDNLSKNACDKLNTKLNGLICNNDSLNPSGKVSSIGNTPYNSEDVKEAVNELAVGLDQSSVIALGSVSCNVRTAMLQDQSSKFDDLSKGTGKPIIEGAGGRSNGAISDLEQALNGTSAGVDRPNLNEFEGLRCNESNDCFMGEKVSEILTSNKNGYKCDISAVDNSQSQNSSSQSNGSGTSNGSNGSSPDTDFLSRVQDDINRSRNTDSPSNNIVSNGGNTSGSPRDVNSLNIGGGSGVNATGTGVNTPAGNSFEGTVIDQVNPGGATNLLGFADGANSQMGNAGAGDEGGFSSMISQDIVDKVTQEAADKAAMSRDPASDDESGLDISSLSDEQLKELSDRMGVDVSDIKDKNEVKSKGDLEEGSALSQLIKSMESQQKSNQEIIDELRKQNATLADRLSKVEAVGRDASSSNSSIAVTGGNATAGEAYKSSNYAYDMANNSFVAKSTITGDDRAKFSPTFNEESGLQASNFSGYSGSRRAAMRAGDSDINQEFLTLIAGEGASYDNVQSNKENVEKYVDFVKEKGSIIHLVKYNAQGEPISIKVPWSDEELPLEGELATLKDKIPPQDEALSSEESQYGLYKMVEFNQSLQAFFASEAKEQVQLASLIDILEEAEE